jgi:hypothetical protein
MVREYVEDFLDGIDEKQKQRILKTMNKYGNNHWWRSDDSIIIAKHQVFEPVLMVPIDTFTESLEKLLGRPVYTFELADYDEDLKNEAEEAIELHEKGLMTMLTKSKMGKELAAKKVRNNLLRFEAEMQDKGKDIIYVNENGEVENTSEDKDKMK